MWMTVEVALAFAVTTALLSSAIASGPGGISTTSTP